MRVSLLFPSTLLTISSGVANSFERGCASRAGLVGALLTQPQQDLMMSFGAGRKAPPFCISSGRLFLARLSDEELQRNLEGSRRKAYTSYTQTRTDRIFADVHRVRKHGFAMSNQEYVMHIAGAAVPVVTAESKHIAALSVPALNVRASLERLRRAAACGGRAFPEFHSAVQPSARCGSV